MFLRIATLDDVTAIQRLIARSVRELSSNYYSDDQIENALLHIFGVDTQLIEDETYFVVEVEGEIVGAGGWSRRSTLYGGDQMKSSGADLELDPANEAARLRAFYVRPDWARKGIGKQIVKACEDAASSAGFRRLELIATLPGEPLYTALGYIRLEPVDLPLPDGTSLPAFRMEKMLIEDHPQTTQKPEDRRQKS